MVVCFTVLLTASGTGYAVELSLGIDGGISTVVGIGCIYQGRALRYPNNLTPYPH